MNGKPRAYVLIFSQNSAEEDTIASLVMTSSSTATGSPQIGKLITRVGFTVNRHCCLAFPNGYSSLFPIPSQKLPPRLRASPVTAAAKKKNGKDKKADSHSFVSKPDEATGPFPEAVLLKQSLNRSSFVALTSTDIVDSGPVGSPGFLPSILKKVQEDGRLQPEFADAEERELYDFLNLQLESDLDVEQMRHYEVVYLIHEDHMEEVEDVNLKVQDFLRENKGKVWRFSDWGVRRLAYKIKKAKRAHYILMNFELEAKLINDFKSMLDKDERVIRHLVIKRDKAITEDCPPPPEFQSLRAGMDDDDDDDDDDDYDDYEAEEGVIYVDDDEEGERVKKTTKTTTLGRKGRSLTAEKVGR
ncbi:hypothetical protein RJ639_004948 [Escallonia herrerae]|uniref:30S ribosomal protein S6 n=1 Tax=Escallonia herrerae TaxID=1293975 RepID=A0AA89B176_9ASTE|nr:hypothetical protein RJ639_004948 [Escallonia herrerae]